MATNTQRSKIRKIVDLDVQEISIVDNPANGIPTLLYKRAASGAMPTELAKYAPVPTESSVSLDYDSPSVMKLLGSL